LQQSASAWQIWPKTPHVEASGGGLPASTGPQGPHVPLALPVERTHAVPGQQSAFVVYVPHAATHCWPVHTYGGVPPSTGFGTHGIPPQQFALDAQAWPASTQAPAQRGTPTLSWMHVFWFSQLPLQQSHDALHDIVCSLQTSPSGLHPIGRRHTPTWAPAAISHVTGLPEPPGRPADPQQSLSFTHKSPTT